MNDSNHYTIIQSLRFIGGMILDWDCLQEEILFAIRPEMIVTLLFTERLENNEALLITGEYF